MLFGKRYKFMETKDNPKTIDEYISKFKPETQEILKQVRHIIHESAPEATEKISYQMPTFFLNGNLVHFAAFEKHIGFYPTPSGIVEFSDELAKYKSGKGSAQFPLDKPIPYDLIREMVKFRVQENMRPNKLKK
jgi:uncharacterized protein YdhG (YjbR/CyaY superfamily)